MGKRPPDILDTTLRDGSYVIDFQFTPDDTALIASVLEFAGIRLIEIGHGLGLGAAREGHGDQPCTDEAYLRAAAAALNDGRFGAFFIPGIGNEDDLRLARDCGASFIRVGTNVTELEQAEAFIRKAKALGFETFSNLMKSYAVSPEEFAECAERARDYGADVVCLVDSAGGMLPDDVRTYLEAVLSVSDVRLGFHGHNNLAMAMANTLEAYSAGAAILDASLQGMGRSEGNASTEILAAILQKDGLLDEIDVNALLDASEAFVRPLLRNKGYSGLGITFGRAKFHSSFLGLVLSTAKEFGVDPRDLILAVSDRDQVNPPAELVQRIARDLVSAAPRAPVRFALTEELDSPDSDFQADLLRRARQLKERARKTDLPAVMNVVVSPYEPTHVSPYVETGYGCALANVMLADADRLIDTLRTLDPYADYILVDPRDTAPDVSLAHARVITYSDDAMLVRAVVGHLSALLSHGLAGKRIGIVGNPELTSLLEQQLAPEGAVPFAVSVVGTDPDALLPDKVCVEKLERADALIGMSPRTACITPVLVGCLPSGSLLFDGAIGSLDERAIASARERSIRVVRIDLRPALAATALERIHFQAIASERMGHEVWEGIGVVAGGHIGRQGEIVVDNIRNPRRIIGVADGLGGITAAIENSEAVQAIRRIIAERQLKG